MHRFVVAISMLLLVTGAAMAGERRWEGFYIGGNLGYGSARASADFSLLGVPVINGSEDLDGAVYGAQAGYNFQFGRVVLGLETDIQGTSQKASATRLCPALTCGVAVTQTSEDSIEWLGTARLRAGAAFDRVLVYATGGAGYGSFKSTQTLTTTLSSVTNANEEQRLAWVIGGGVEAAITDRWSVKAEYLYLDSGTKTTTYSLAGVGLITEDGRLTENILRLGVNYRF